MQLLLLLGGIRFRLGFDWQRFGKILRRYYMAKSKYWETDSITVNMQHYCKWIIKLYFAITQVTLKIYLQTNYFLKVNNMLCNKTLYNDGTCLLPIPIRTFWRCFVLTHNDSFLHTPESRLKTPEKLRGQKNSEYDRGLSTVFLFSIAKWREKNWTNVSLH